MCTDMCVNTCMDMCTGVCKDKSVQTCPHCTYPCTCACACGRACALCGMHVCSAAVQCFAVRVHALAVCAACCTLYLVGCSKSRFGVFRPGSCSRTTRTSSKLLSAHVCACFEYACRTLRVIRVVYFGTRGGTWQYELHPGAAFVFQEAGHHPVLQFLYK